MKNLSAREPSALGLDTNYKKYYLCLAAASATIKWYICSIHHDHDKIRLQLLWFYPVQEQQWLLKHLWVYLPWFFLQTELCFSIGILLYHPSLLNNFLFSIWISLWIKVTLVFRFQYGHISFSGFHFICFYKFIYYHIWILCQTSLNLLQDRIRKGCIYY